MNAGKFFSGRFQVPLEISRSLDDGKIEQLAAERDYEELNFYILDAMLRK